MEHGQKIGNTTDYMVNPCQYTISYYTKQINDALKQAFKENPSWVNPGSREDVIFIIDEIQEWYNPFLYTDLVSSTFDRLWRQAINELLHILNEKVPKVKKNNYKSQAELKDRIGQCYDPVKLENVIDRLREQGMSLKTIGNLSGVHFTTISHMKKGTGPYWRKRVTPSMNMLIDFLESIGIDTEDLIIINDEYHSEVVKSNKSFCGGSGGGFFKKSPLAAGGRKGGNHE